MTDLFLCDKCNSQFKIGDGGFLGSQEDFEFQMDRDDNSLKNEYSSFECSPFMNYVQLCPKCYKKDDSNDK